MSGDIVGGLELPANPETVSTTERVVVIKTSGEARRQPRRYSFYRSGGRLVLRLVGRSPIRGVAVWPWQVDLDSPSDLAEQLAALEDLSRLWRLLYAMGALADVVLVLFPVAALRYLGIWTVSEAAAICAYVIPLVLVSVVAVIATAGIAVDVLRVRRQIRMSHEQRS